MSCKTRSSKGHDVDVVTYVECPSPHAIPSRASGMHQIEIRSFAPEAVSVEFTSDCDPAGPLFYANLTIGQQWKLPGPVTIQPPPPWWNVATYHYEEKIEHNGGSIPGGVESIEILVRWRSAGRQWENQIEPLQLNIKC